jgi:hypothetical protein
MSPRRLQIDRAVILKEIAVAYDIMKVRAQLTLRSPVMD